MRNCDSKSTLSLAMEIQKRGKGKARVECVLLGGTWLDSAETWSTLRTLT